MKTNPKKADTIPKSMVNIKLITNNGNYHTNLEWFYSSANSPTTIGIFTPYSIK